mmetsp:Transcript_29326/g.28487  ORF Transcript_29326/g.28487 Transcript_29326/m.28487 type:complete len:134 (+) Transcript_29326:745-1146(+)
MEEYKESRNLTIDNELRRDSEVIKSIISSESGGESKGSILKQEGRSRRHQTPKISSSFFIEQEVGEDQLFQKSSLIKQIVLGYQRHQTELPERKQDELQDSLTVTIEQAQEENEMKYRRIQTNKNLEVPLRGS